MELLLTYKARRGYPVFVEWGIDEWYGIPNTTGESVYSSLEGFAESGITETFVFRLLDQKRVTRRRGAVQ